MKAKMLGWTMRAMATIGGAWICAGCGAHTVTATGGATFREADTLPDPMSSALKASAAHDLPCDSAYVDVKRLEAEREYEVTGCGYRVLYRAETPSVRSKQLELVSRAPWTPDGNVASTPAPPAPAATVKRPDA